MFAINAFDKKQMLINNSKTRLIICPRETSRMSDEIVDILILVQ